MVSSTFIGRTKRSETNLEQACCHARVPHQSPLVAQF